MITIEFGNRIRDLRSAQGYTQETFATQCGLHRTYIAGIESGNRNITLESMEKIADALQVSLAELFQFNAPIHTTLLLQVDDESFLMETNQELTGEVKDEIEIICRLAYDDDEPSLDAALNKSGIESIYDASAYDIALALQTTLKDELNLSAVFKPIDAEAKISE